MFSWNYWLMMGMSYEQNTMGKGPNLSPWGLANVELSYKSQPLHVHVVQYIYLQPFAIKHRKRAQYRCAAKHGSGAVLVTLQLRPWHNTWQRPWQLPLQPLRRQRRHWPRYAVPKYKDWPLSPRNLSSLAGQKKTAGCGRIGALPWPITWRRKTNSTPQRSKQRWKDTMRWWWPQAETQDSSWSLWECPWKWKTSHNAEGPCAGLNRLWSHEEVPLGHRAKIGGSGFRLARNDLDGSSST